MPEYKKISKNNDRQKPINSLFSISFLSTYNIK